MLSMLGRLIETACWAYNLGLVVFVIASYPRARWAKQLRRRLSLFYEPALNTLRRLLPTARLGRSQFDLAPVALFLLVILFRNVVVYILLGS